MIIESAPSAHARPVGARHRSVKSIMLIGPPGAGKGTQGELLSGLLDVPHITTGGLIREEIARKTPLGLRVKDVIARGDLVADADMEALLDHRLAERDAQSGYILDGYPRDLNQARSFAKTPAGARLDAVVALALSEADAVKRLAGRLVCPTCGQSYHSDGSANAPVACAQDGTLLARRPDDEPEAVQHRMKIYEELTSPLLGYYRDQGLLTSVDAASEPEQVFYDIRKLLGIEQTKS